MRAKPSRNAYPDTQLRQPTLPSICQLARTALVYKRLLKNHTKLERKYELALGPRYIFKKRKLCPEILVTYLEAYQERKPVEPAEEEKNSRQNSIL